MITLRTGGPSNAEVKFLIAIALDQVDSFISGVSNKTEKSASDHHKAFSGSAVSGHVQQLRVMQLLWEISIILLMASNRKFLLLCAFVVGAVAGTSESCLNIFRWILFEMEYLSEVRKDVFPATVMENTDSLFFLVKNSWWKYNTVWIRDRCFPRLERSFVFSMIATGKTAFRKKYFRSVIYTFL